MSGKGERFEKLIMRMVDVCCLLQVRWRGQGARMWAFYGRKFKFWLSVIGMELVV